MTESRKTKQDSSTKAAGKSHSRPKAANQLTAKVTPKQQAFIDHYLIDLNATQAAIRAGYSPKTAGQQAFDLLKKPEIQRAIETARAETAQKLEITRERVLEEYAKLAFLDPRKFYNPDGTLKLVPDMDEDAAAALMGFEVDEIKMGDDAPSIGITKKIKWHDKKAALDSIARMMGWNQDKLKLQGDEENPIQVAARVVIVPQKETAQVSTKPVKNDNERG